MSNKINMTIDGKSISVNPGLTIYWAAKKLGIECKIFAWDSASNHSLSR